ncbi:MULTISPECIES: GntR family transcriptional regulator [Micromonospora]|uniref:Transcriptional regulator, GntR family n=1 Tax=Micromonospora yangpuensis TaxID=683228 RepID=A0A1C6VI87_9ACTN|nr:GntR family transcriptional regulator [Micromonospora yangpuensis]GGM00136.1 transcriptional regulator [Micromonospora yangpuensis]SCL66001.1 transcriptional regulator, GntR family [Micromonospora yangpuensis]
MPRLAKDPRSRHQQIAADLRAMILAKDLSPGSKLPSTAQLQQEYGVPNQTVQNAVAVLKREGYADSAPGKGVFVRERPQHIVTPAAFIAPPPAGQSYPWLSEAERRGLKGVVDLLNVAEVAPPAQVRLAFDLGEGEVAVLRKQLLRLDDEPAELVHSYYPVDLARGTPLAEKRRIKGGALRALGDMGIAPYEFIDQVSTRPPTPEEHVALELPPDTSIMRTFRVVYAEGRRPIEATVMVKAGHMYELQYHHIVAPAAD